MARPLRIEFDGAWYHVMNRGAGKRAVFINDAHRGCFLALLDKVTRTYRVEIHAYCLMDNHYHLVIRTPEAGLSRAMQHVNGVYAQRFNRMEGTDGPLFRGRYAAKVVDSDSYLARLVRYVHLNPVESGIVGRPEAYAASSCRAYLGLATRPAWLRTEHCLGMFGEDAETARRAYRRFLDEGLDDQFRAYHEAGWIDPVLGGDAFRREIQDDPLVRTRRRDAEFPDARRIVQPALEDVGRAVCEEFHLTERELRHSTRGHGGARSDARGAFVYACRHHGTHPLLAVARWLGFRSRAGASSAMARFEHRLRNRPDLRCRLDRILSRLHEVKT